MAEARNEIVSQMLFARETPEGRANEIGDSVTTANDPRWGDRHAGGGAARDRGRRAAGRAPLSHRSEPGLDPLSRSGAAHRRGGARPVRAAHRRRRSAGPSRRRPERRTSSPPKASARRRPRRASRRPFSAPAFAERRLANGMRVVIARSTAVPIASALLVFGGGTSADPAARPGVASMMAGLIDNGAAGMTAPELAARVESLGARIGGSANHRQQLRLRDRADRQSRGGRRAARPDRARAGLRAGGAGARAAARARSAPGEHARPLVRRPARRLSRGLWRRALRRPAGRHAGLAGGADPRRSRRLSPRLVAARTMRLWSSPGRWTPRPASRWPSGCSANGRRRRSRCRNCPPTAPARRGRRA